MNLAGLHDKAMNFMAGYFNDHGQLPAMFFALDHEQNLHLLAPDNYAEKRRFYMTVLSAYFFKYRVSAYGVAMEAWTSPTCVETGLLPSESTDRIEIVSTLAVSADDVLQAAFRIIREPGKPPRIGEQYRPEGVPAGAKMEVAREGMAGLLNGPDQPIDEAGRAIIENIVELTLLRQPPYFPVRKILKPAEYDHDRN